MQSIGGSNNDFEKASNTKKNSKEMDSFKNNEKEMAKNSSFVDIDDDSGHLLISFTLNKVWYLWL
jgi:hypothetical protein